MLICGVDEAGRGPLAGPVVAAAVVFEAGYINSAIKDSKQLSAKKRDELISIIYRDAKQVAVIAVGHQRIDQINILQATRLAMKLAVQRVTADLVLVDGNVRIECPYEQRTVVQGDKLHVEISAASIIAKTYRDSLMQTLAQRFPQYGFDSHAGYPTEAHRKAVANFGPCPVHRRTFRGVKEFLGQQYSQEKFSHSALAG